MAEFVKTHLLGLCLFCIHLTRQESCSTPGSLTSPQMLLHSLSHDEVHVNCLIPPLSEFSRVIFCKDGKEMKIQEQQDSVFAYIFHYKISEDGAGQISCMFQLKDNENQVKNSGLSNFKFFPEALENEDSSRLPSLSRLSLIIRLGITVASVPIFVGICYGLIKMV